MTPGVVRRLVVLLTTPFLSLGPPSSSLASAAGSPPEGVPPQKSGADISQISVGLDTLTLLNGKKGDIEILQLLRVVNSSDAPYLGEESEDLSPGDSETARTVFRLPIPEGAFDIAPSDLSNPQGMSEGPAGIVTTVPLPPGETLLSFIYRVRPSRTGWALRRQIDYPTRSVNLLLGPGLDLESAPGFRLTERKQLGSVEYRRFRAGPFSPGSVLTADVGFGGNAPDRVWAAFASATAVLAVLVLGAAMVLRRKRRGAPQVKVPQTSREVTGSREELILEIARLDEDFDSGSIPEDPYRARRRALKQKLGELSESVKR